MEFASKKSAHHGIMFIGHWWLCRMISEGQRYERSCHALTLSIPKDVCSTVLLHDQRRRFSPIPMAFLPVLRGQDPTKGEWLPASEIILLLFIGNVALANPSPGVQHEHGLRLKKTRPHLHRLLTGHAED